MTYIARDGKVWAIPYGGEYVGDSTDGVPMYFQGTHLCAAKLISQPKDRA